MSFDEIKGQSLAVRLLKSAAENKKVASTYLFYGPEGTGKGLTAKEFAKALNCERLEDAPCDVCRSCMLIDRKEHPDVNWFYPLGVSRSIKIEQVRQLQHMVSWKSFEGRSKVVVINAADMLTQEAGNALLKTLEEPPLNSVFVLTTSRKDAVLPTITSRSQEIQFFSLTKEIVCDILKNKLQYSGKDAEILSQLSEGSIGKALEYSSENIYNQRIKILDIVSKAKFDNMGDLMDNVEGIMETLKTFKDNLSAEIKRDENNRITGEEKEAYIAGRHRGRIEEILGLIKSWYRDILIYKITQKPDLVINRDYLSSIESLRDTSEIKNLENKLNVIEEIREGLARNVNLKLLFQLMFIRLEMI